MSKALALFLAVILLQAHQNHAQAKPVRTVNPPVGSVVNVTPGQRFYADFVTESVPAYKLERPFKSSMAGAMGLPFSFAIDSDILIYAGKSRDGRWSYFVPEGRKFRASHGLLGSVIRDGDAVGLRVNDDGRREWFVDNSVYNGSTTIWSRRVKDKDPRLSLIQTSRSEPVKDSILHRLFYLGTVDNKVRVRHEQISPDGTLRDEYTFPIDADGRALGAVRGAEFAIIAGPLKAEIVVMRPMTDEFGDPQ